MHLFIELNELASVITRSFRSREPEPVQSCYLSEILQVGNGRAGFSRRVPCSGQRTLTPSGSDTLSCYTVASACPFYESNSSHWVPR